MAEVIIKTNFNGPPTSGNGGYVAGLLANEVNGAAKVLLKQPPALDTPMQLESDGELARLYDNGAIVAEAHATELELDVPQPPSFAEAENFSKAFTGFDHHDYPTCFVCGPDRPHHDGLHIFAGRTDDPKMVASPFVPYAALCDDDGLVKNEFIWAALDCSGYFSITEMDTSRMLLGAMLGKTNPILKQEENCVVIGWEISRDGRKHFTGTAIFSESGECAGVSEQIWIELKDR